MIKIHDYAIVKNKIGEIIVAGIVKAIKYNYFCHSEKKPFFGISFDNMHFFTEWNNEIYFEENPNHIEKEMNIDGIDVVLWSDITNKPHSSVYRDYDITELDSNLINADFVENYVSSDDTAVGGAIYNDDNIIDDKIGRASCRERVFMMV